MSRNIIGAAALCAVLGWVRSPLWADAPAEGLAQPPPDGPAVVLTLREALALAKRSSPAALSGRARVGEAAGRLDGASVFPRQNPVLEGGVGPRIAPDDTSVTVSVSLTQSFDLGGGRGARIDAVEAAVERTEAETDAEMQRVLRAVGIAFVRAQWADERVRLDGELVGVAEETLRVAERRLQAGDVTSVEVSVARAALARSRSASKTTEALRDTAMGELRVLLGTPHETKLVVRPGLSEPRRLDVAQLLAKAKNRPDLRALSAELREAQADIDLGDALAWPQIGLGARYEHEEREVHTVQGVVSLTLPIFERAQGISAEGEARKSRAETDLTLRKAQVTTEVRSAFDVFRRRVEAVEALEQGGVAGFQESVALATKGYDAGETTLTELLLLRRELIDARVDYLDRKLDAAIAALELEAVAGMLP